MSDEEYIDIPGGSGSAPEMPSSISIILDSWVFGDCKRCRVGRCALFAGLTIAFSLNAWLFWMVLNGM